MQEKLTFEILCTTMNQSGFEKIKTMNVQTNIVLANQTSFVDYKEFAFDGEHVARLVSTNTQGVGINRNISLLYARGDICLLADDDMEFVNNLENVVLNDFANHPDADVIIFNIKTNSKNRPEKVNSKFRRLSLFERTPYGAVRIAFRLKSIKKINASFNCLFGGGCKYLAGEDSLFLSFLKKNKLRIYLSNQYIGKTDTRVSSWFSGYDNRYFYSKGAFLKASNKKPFVLWALYYAIRTKKYSSLKIREKMIWMGRGKKSYKNIESFDEFVTSNEKR